MHLELIANHDASNNVVQKIAHRVFMETGASSLLGVEAMTSMIANIASATGRTFKDIVSDAELFPSVATAEVRGFGTRGFDMCMRVARRMICGALPDMCCGAVRFHHADTMPQWAVARGYIADIDGMLFYL